MPNDFDTNTLVDQVKSRARSQRYNTCIAFKQQRREKHPDSRHWRKWGYSNNGFARRCASCGCCPKKYANRRNHGNHTCNGYMGDNCPSSHGLRMKKRAQGILEVTQWRKIDYDEETFLNENLL
ncbi:unnamed protein product [Adineta steineri]|uniref:Uncharacterized protein n=1 Tax=Adineta steineri TaxID=433720 RepID=A0A819B7L7_9BILA|nr:unnamed protein product [Adineta steineri]CAF1236979.1 unnamed protein product [Adineta steineri]CAF3798917.1 unnamed protein product [Adineta steineri]